MKERSVFHDDASDNIWLCQLVVLSVLPFGLLVILIVVLQWVFRHHSRHILIHTSDYRVGIKLITVNRRSVVNI